MRRWIGMGAVLGAVALVMPNVVSVWVDENGRTVLTDREEGLGEAARRVDPEQLGSLWEGEVTGEPLEPGSTSFGEEDRYLMAVLAARTDVRRGEMSRGLKELRRLVGRYPSRPEAGYLLALVERHRGRLEAAHAILERVLAIPAELPPRWRETALSLQRELDEEIAIAADQSQGWEERYLDLDHFRITYDHQFAGRAYGQRVAGLLGQARERMRSAFGVVMSRPLDVRLYTKAHYLENYRHRFGFATVGFYDGTIHVVSARHPRQELFALLVHEYGHALFLEALGSHQPFFLNEGICDREEERARGRERVSRGEWRQLMDAIREENWIPLETLIRGFDGVKGRRALLAYLESRAAVELIETRHPGAIGRWLERVRAGQDWEPALSAETGWDTRGLEAALQKEALSRFLPDPLVRAAQGPLGG